MRTITLSDGWELKQREPSRDIDADMEGGEWLPARVPGTVHEALLAAGAIPDPFYGTNENDLQWIGTSDWLYRCTFEQPDAAGQPAVLCFDGLDTIATVWLNGQQLFRSTSMFVPQRADVSALLKPGANTLHILFESALRYGQAQEAEYGKRAVWNGDASRVYVRKAQYHYGWDWGPCLLTAGPWRPVRLELGAARIVELHCPAVVADDLGSATLPVEVTLDGAAPSDTGLVRLELYSPDGDLLDRAELPVAAGALAHSFRVEQPELWWPNGYGAQPCYRLAATLLAGASQEPADSRELRVGLRRLRLVQEPLLDESGTTFLFEVNNTPLFCGGANWIPADSFTPRIPAERYRALLAQAATAHMTMIRVWGGGIYEDAVFYELCDELGLLVWQDFMFACGIYPAHPEFVALVRAEAEAEVRRLRHHACIALWCGNNEDYQIAESIRVYDPDGPVENEAFPARLIYERVLPEVCAALDPTRSYWPGSAYGGRSPGDPTQGDRHTWDVWHGAMAPVESYPAYEGRFVSEFGMGALPALQTIEDCTPPAERFFESRTLEHHHKADGGQRRLAAYMIDALRAPTTLEGAVYATQFVQAAAMTAAYAGWRRRWAGPGRYAVSGALVWQLDDCWPTTSWAVIDYALRPKPALYAIRRAMAPLAVGVARDAGGAAVWAVNGTPTPIEAELVLRVVGLDGLERSIERRTVELGPLRSVEFGVTALPAECVLQAQLQLGGAVAARAALWPSPLKYLDLPEPAISVTRLGGDRLLLRAERPATGVWLQASDGVEWSDNMLDLVPGDEQTIVASGLGEGEVQVRWLRWT